MKKKIKMKIKIKSSKRTAKPSSEDQPEMPNLVAVMMKVAERLEALEKKMDAMMSQASRPVPQNSPRPQPSLPGQMPQRQNHGPQPHQGRGERPLYQATCADCSKSCEIPFKPTGERPVYCKECFAARKASRKGNHPASGNHFSSAGQGARMEKRQVKVYPSGVGKVTITEMVPVRKNRKPVKGSKR